MEDLQARIQIAKPPAQLSPVEPVLEFIVSRGGGGNVDDWGDPSRLHEVTTGETMRRLADEERRAGHKPW